MRAACGAVFQIAKFVVDLFDQGRGGQLLHLDEVRVVGNICERGMPSLPPCHAAEHYAQPCSFPEKGSNRDCRVLFLDCFKASRLMEKLHNTGKTSVLM